MKIVAAFVLVFFGIFFALALTGCLPAMPGDPYAAGGGAPGSGSGGGGGGDSTGGNGSTGGGGTTGGGGGSTGAGGVDAGTPPVADLGTAPAGDLGGGGGGGGGGGDMAVACDNLAATTATGQHNAGQDCQSCHAAGGGAPTFTMGGTLYSAASGGTAVTGGTINVTDAAGKTVKLVSAKNGNFWTTTALTFPVKVNASLCPATVPMSATVGGNGACNNCHNSTFRVHVP
jgi:hypothetical protein